MNHLKRFGSVAIILAGIAAASMGTWACSSQASSITIGTTTSEVNSLLHITQDRNYFTANGLNVTIKVYASGKAAIEAMLNGEVDLATGSEFAFAGRVLAKDNIRLVGIINRSSVEYLAGRTDKGIKDISDLKGKRIGVPMGSRPEFALGRLLFLRGIDTSEVTLVNIIPDQSVNALVNGDVDAVSIWQPYINQIRDRLGERAVVWSTQNAQASYNGVMSTARWTVEHPDLVTRFLQSLIQAETYNGSNPEAARAIIQQKLAYSDEYIAAVWPDYQFSVSLDQSLIAAMEDEARWMISHNLTDEKQVPDFMNYIFEGSLKALKPEAVRIIK